MRNLGIFALAFQQYLGLALIASVLPVVLRADGAGLEMIGLFSAAMFAFTVNFLWAPVVDRYPLWRGGLRGSWLLGTQIASAIAVAVMGLLDPARDVLALFACGLLLSVIVATQRIATLGYVADVLPAAERGMGTALLGCGAATANAAGGALCLALVARAGWHAGILIFAAGMLVLGLVLIRLPEPSATKPSPRAATPLPVMTGTPRLWAVVAMVSPAAFGVAAAFSMTLPRLVDAGFGMDRVGLLGGGANVLAFFIFAPLAGLAVSRLDGGRAAQGCCLLLAFAFACFCAITPMLGERTIAIGALLLVFCALAIQHVAFTSWFLGLARPGHTAADVTFLTALIAAVALLGFAASGVIARHFGYGATLWGAAAGYLVTALLLTLRHRLPEQAPAFPPGERAPAPAENRAC